MKKNSFISNQERDRIIEAYLIGKSASEIAEIMGLKAPAVHSIIKKYQQGLPILRQQKGGPRRKSIDSDSKERIRTWIDEDCSISLRAIEKRCEEELDIKVGKTTISKCISSFNYSFKRVTQIPERRNNPEVIEARAVYAAEYLNLISAIDDSKIFFLDEVGFNVSMRCRGGRSLIGRRAIKVVPSLRSKNISVCCVMNKNGIFHYKVQNRAFNQDLFSDFINSVIEKLNTCNIESVVLIMDNVPFHKCTSISRLIEEKGHKIVFLPPYSPFLNPIENMFSKWKQKVRSLNVQTEEELLSAIDNISLLITPEECTNYCRHMFSLMHRILLKEPIYDE